MSEIPRGWSTAPIRLLCKLENGRAFKPTEWRPRGIPIVRIQNLNNPNAAYNYFDGQFEDRYFLRGGELLFAWSGTPGTSFGAHIWRGGEAVLNQHIFRVDFDESSLDKRFFRYAINQKLEELIGIAHGGVGLRHVTKGKFENTEVSIPPLNEQKRIADKLDAVLPRLDACRERLDRVPAILKRFRQSVLAAATFGKLTEEWREANPHLVDAADLAVQIQIAHKKAGGHRAGNAAPPTDDVHDLSTEMFPQGWELLTLRDLVQPDRPITYGILKPGPEVDKGVPYVRVADFPNDKLNLATVRKTSPAIDQEFKRSRLYDGDILLSIRGTVGRLVVVPAELVGANITQDSARLTIQPVVSRDYVLWFLRSDLAQSRMKGAVKGVAVRGINIGDVRALQVPLPSRHEQDEIVRRVEALFSYADRLEARYKAALSEVERLTPALLAKAFRGELVPQDPHDEPASVLLERIRAARSENGDMKQGRGRRIVAQVSVPREESAMTKSRNDEDVKYKPYIADLLRGTGGNASVEDLFRQAELSVVDFYKQLAWEIENGHIRDDDAKLEAA